MEKLCPWLVYGPVIWLPSKEGVPFERIMETLPQFKGWVRQGIKLSKENFEILESMLREKEQEDIKKEKLAYKEGAEAFEGEKAEAEAKRKAEKERIRKILEKCGFCVECGKKIQKGWKFCRSAPQP